MELIFDITSEFVNPEHLIYLNKKYYNENICSHKINLKKFLYNCIHIQLYTLIWTAAYSNFYMNTGIIFDAFSSKNSIYSIIKSQVKNIINNVLV